MFQILLGVNYSNKKNVFTCTQVCVICSDEDLFCRAGLSCFSDLFGNTKHVASLLFSGGGAIDTVYWPLYKS